LGDSARRHNRLDSGDGVLESTIALASIRVMIVDDSAAVRQGLESILRASPGMTVVATAVNGEQAVDGVAAHAPDVVLMGKQATDDDNGQAAQMLAAKLGWPQATYAAKIVLGDGKATVTRETDTGEETLSLSLPCVITTDLRLNEPRYIPLPGIIKARGKPLERRPRATDAQPKTRVLSIESPPARPPGRVVKSVDELVAALRERGAI